MPLETLKEQLDEQLRHQVRNSALNRLKPLSMTSSWDIFVDLYVPDCWISVSPGCWIGL